MLVLGIETSCDETAVGIVDGKGNQIANIVASQAVIHSKYGGIIPEIASRQHILDIGKTTYLALKNADLDLGDIDLIAVTYGPGLAGSLIVGLNYAKGLASSLGLPLVGVNHLEGHIYAAWINNKSYSPKPFQTQVNKDSKIMCLLVSGGHTELILMEDIGKFNIIGETRDDAAGEAFDKVARVIGLNYPGGPEIQRMSELAIEKIDPFPRSWIAGTDDFSFSGIKTAVINRSKKLGFYPPNKKNFPNKDIQSSFSRAFQDSVVDVLVTKTIRAADKFKCKGIVLVGGVAANKILRDQLLSNSHLPVSIPPINLCTDNGVMIAMAGLNNFKQGKTNDMSLDVLPSLRI